MTQVAIPLPKLETTTWYIQVIPFVIDQVYLLHQSKKCFSMIRIGLLKSVSGDIGQ